MTIMVKAQFVETSLNDDEGRSSLFIKWGPAGQYIDLVREESGGKIYCELFDQANGAEFESIRFNYSENLLVLEVTPPEAFVRAQAEHRVEIALDGASVGGRELKNCLRHLFRAD